jgi:hypothetical protein
MDGIGGITAMKISGGECLLNSQFRVPQQGLFLAFREGRGLLQENCASHWDCGQLIL